MKKTKQNLINQFINDKNLSQKEKDTIVGTTLGDSHIRWSLNKKTVSLSYGYAKKFYAIYVLENLKNLSNYISPTENQNLDKRYKKIRYSYTFSLRSLSSLIVFAKLFTKPIVKNDKESFIKVLPSYKILFELITPRALAFWIMDDGHKYKRGGITLCTDSFTLAEVKRLIKVLTTKFNLICTIHTKKSNDKSSVYHRIYIVADSLPLLYSLVFEFFCSEMLYKIKFNTKTPLSQSKKNIKARAERLALKIWKLKHGNISLPSKSPRIYSTNPRAVKARLARQALKKVESK